MFILTKDTSVCKNNNSNIQLKQDHNNIKHIHTAHAIPTYTTTERSTEQRQRHNSKHAGQYIRYYSFRPIKQTMVLESKAL